MGMSRTYVVILSGGTCQIVEMTDARFKDKRENFDDDWSVYVEAALSEELEMLPSGMQWAVIDEGNFFYDLHKPLFKKLK